MGWVGHVARMCCIHGYDGVNLRKSSHLEDPNFFERIML